MKPSLCLLRAIKLAHVINEVPCDRVSARRIEQGSKFLLQLTVRPSGIGNSGTKLPQDEKNGNGPRNPKRQKTESTTG